MTSLAIVLLILAIVAAIWSLIASHASGRVVLEAARPETDTEYRASLLTIATAARRLDNIAEWAAISRDRGDLAILARYVDGDCYRDTCNANGFDPLADKATS